ncbi:TnpV protein [Anaeromassilibacillus senegalensis]|uniref:TnpV protein n=1 Tax=Anaeromassilibacillus senegalensis TaxID=1673717 RepID=A0ABS9CMK9_9FIRM|nr:TnpV protein [Anaeromassilibacillus senegalensis]MCF2651848.1 TnpV protein [Anaeromassilibacillus senegalensis]
MEKFITDERTGLRYELVGDYYLIAGEDEPEEQHSISIWGQRHLRYLKEHRRVLYANLLTKGKLNGYLVDVDQQAEEMFARLTKQMAAAEGITEGLKTTDQMKWVRWMNSIRNRAMEIVNSEIIDA